MNDQLRYSKWSLASAIENLRWNPFLLPSIKFNQASPWSKWTNKETLPQPLGTLEEVDQSLVYKHWEFCNGDTLSNSSYPSLLESHFLQIVVKKSQLTWSYVFSISILHIIPLMSLFILKLMALFMMRTICKICLPSTKVCWWLDTTFPITFLSLFVTFKHNIFIMSYRIA